MPLISTVQYRSHVGLMRLLTTKSMHFFSTHSTHTIPLIHKQATTAPAHIPQYHSHTFACMFSCVQLFATLWSAACQAPLSMEFPMARILEGTAISYSRGSSQPRDRTRVSRVFCIFCTGRQILYHCVTWEAQLSLSATTTEPVL